MINILFVDDEQAILDVGKLYLEKTKDFQVDTTTSVQDAQILMRNNSYDAVLSDYLMPEMNGIEFLKIIRTDETKLPFIFFTGKGSESVLIQAINNGANYFLEKGANPGSCFLEIAQSIKQAALQYQAEKIIEQNEHKFRLLTDFTQDWIYWLDQNGSFVYISPSCEQMTGYSMYEFYRDPSLLYRIIIEEDQKIWNAHITDSSETSDPISIDLRIIHKNGEIRWINHGCLPIYDKDGKYLGRRAGNRDITDRKRVEESLALANKKLNLLSAFTRHDILNMITALGLNIDASLLCCRDPEVNQYLLRGLRILNSIKNEIEFTRDYQDLGVFSPVWHEIFPIINQAIKKINSSVLKISNNTENLEIFADPMIGKVFHTIVDNTIRHGEFASEIEFNYIRRENEIRLVCRDNGIGIPEDQKERIFRKGVGQHTGFGLFLAKEILSITGIKMIETGVYGNGAQFELIIPHGGSKISKTEK